MTTLLQLRRRPSRNDLGVTSGGGKDCEGSRRAGQTPLDFVARACRPRADSWTFDVGYFRGCVSAQLPQTNFTGVYAVFCR